MTPEEFRRALHKLPAGEFGKAVAPLDEKQRKALRAVIKEENKELDRRSFLGPIVGRDYMRQIKKQQREHDKWLRKNPFIENNLILAVFACGTAKEVERVATWRLDEDDHKAIDGILEDRKPSWLSGWVNRQLDTEFHGLRWDTVWSLYRAGVIEKPASDGYTQLFVDAMRGFDSQRPDAYVPTTARLLAEPEFLEDEIWRLFEIETTALTQDWEANYHNVPKDYETWSAAIVKLANDGHLDRDRLLDRSLSSMLREFKQNQLSAFGKLHLALEPNEAEMVGRQAGYLELLVSPTSAVVSFAVKVLTKLGKSTEFDSRAFLEGARPVFAHKQKGMATQALRLASRLCTGNDGLADAGFDIAVAAMAHASPDVQALALDLAEATMPCASDDQRTQFERQSAFLAPKLVARAAAMTGDVDVEATVDAPDTDQLAAVVAGLPDAIRSFAGLDGEQELMPAHVAYSATAMPAMDDRPRLEPVESTSALIELAARLVEVCEDENDVELLLDGLARFGGDRSGDFEKLSAPLLHRIQQGQPGSYGIASGWAGVHASITDLLRSWLERKNYDSRGGQYFRESPRDGFPINRLREIQTGILKGKSRQLLATPSWRDGGWIDPLDLVGRLRDYENCGIEAYQYDLMQALLRLAPVNRGAALEKAARLDGDVGKIIRFALDGDDRPDRRARKLAPVWLCAARAREPRGLLREPLGPVARLIPDIPDLITPAEWRYRVYLDKHNSYTYSRVSVEGGYDIEIAEKPYLTYERRLKKQLRRVKWGDWPLAGLHSQIRRHYWAAAYEFSAPWHIRWSATVWPQHQESYFRVAVASLNARIDNDSSRDTPVHHYLTALLDPLRPWGPLATLALCMGLISKSADTRGFAVDALVPGTESGQANPEEAARAFTALFAGGFKLNRFGEVMPQVLEISPLHRWWVAAVVDRIVCGLEEPPKNVYFLYEVALDAMLPIGARPSDAMAEILRGHKGNSKTAKLAKELLALDGMPVDEPAKAVIAEAWTARLAFAERFSGTAVPD